MNKTSTKVLHGEFTIDENGNNSIDNNKLWLIDQISKLDNLNIQHISVDMEAVYTNGKFDKKVKNLGKYADIKRETKFNDNQNATVLFMGSNYDNIILIDVDNIGNTVDTFLDFYEKQNIPECGFVEKTMNGGLHLYYKLTDDQHKQIEGFKSADKQMFIDVLPLDAKGKTGVDIKYTNQLAYGPCYVKDGEHESKTEIIVAEGIFELPPILFDEIHRIVNNKENKVVEPKQNKVVDIVDKPKQKKVVDTYDTDTDSDDEDTGPSKDDILLSFINCLKNNRIEERDYRLRLGFIIKNEGGSFELFNETCKKNPDYDEQAVVKMWKSCKSNRDIKIGIKTLHTWAREDNFEKFKSVVKLTITPKLLKSCISGDKLIDSEIAYILWALNPTKFVFDSKRNQWFCLNEYNYYLQDECELGLIQYINDCNVELMKYAIKSDIKMVIKSYLGDANKKTKIIKELKQVYTIPNVYLLWNEVNPYLFPVKNGVIDLKTQEFRLPKPEEYLTVNNNRMFIPLYNATNKIVKERYEVLKNEIMNKLFRQIFNDEEEIKYWLWSRAISLSRIPFEQFFILYGMSGGNGKGLLTTLLQSAFGNELFGTFNSDHFVKGGKPDQNKETNKQYARMCNTAEIDKDMCLNINKIKSMVGGDPMEVRSIYSKPIVFIPKFGLFFEANYILDFDGFDGGILRRLRCIDHPNKFVSNPTLPHERKIDIHLKARIQKDDELINAFLNMLIEKYLECGTVDIPMPPRFKELTDRIAGLNDPLKNFVNEQLQVGTSEDKIKSSTVYAMFESYLKSNNLVKKSLSRINFHNVMQNYYKRSATKGIDYYRCVKLKASEEDDEDEEVVPQIKK
tara:strand:+ start:182 stop:2728 length:2547 start_codon:yes stop_codon:yes gene_type:complete